MFEQSFYVPPLLGHMELFETIEKNGLEEE
jgi:hypothetical protein